MGSADRGDNQHRRVKARAASGWSHGLLFATRGVELNETLSEPGNARVLRAGLLFWIPPATYLASYLYLANFHGRWFLGETPIHEGGRLDFLEVLLYASHFLGHIPTLLCIALLFAGSYLSVTPAAVELNLSRSFGVSMLLATALFVGGCLLFSLATAGVAETRGFVLQERQVVEGAVRVDGSTTRELGGAWNLHLPSTLLLGIGLPPLLAAARLAFARPVELARKGLPLYFAGALLFMTITVLVNRRHFSLIPDVLTDPRYLAHSVRELVTFALIFFPWVLWILFRRETGCIQPGRKEGRHRRQLRLLGTLAVLFCLGVGAQVSVSLLAGIDQMSQLPDFANGEPLPVLYLLAFHFFEHFLDTWFFLFVVLGFVSLAVRREAEPQSS